MAKTILTTMVLLTITFSTASSFAKKKLDLEDIDVKGELLGDDRLRFYKRQRNTLKNYVNFRKNYRKEIKQNISDYKIIKND